MVRQDAAQARVAGPGDTGPVPSGRLPRGEGRALQLRVDPERIAPALLLAVLVPGVLSLSGAAVRHGFGLDSSGPGGWAAAFDVAGEGNLPTMIQVGVLLLVAAVLWTAGDDADAAGDRWARHWRALGVVFVALAADEVVQGHERAAGLLHEVVTAVPADLAWFLLAVPLLVAAAAGFAGFLRALPRDTVFGVLLAATWYVGGAVVLDALGARLAALGTDPLLVAFLSVVEESMETLGAVTLLLIVARRAAAPGTGERAVAADDQVLDAGDRTGADAGGFVQLSLDLRPFDPQPTYPPVGYSYPPGPQHGSPAVPQAQPQPQQPSAPRTEVLTSLPGAFTTAAYVAPAISGRHASPPTEAGAAGAAGPDAARPRSGRRARRDDEVPVGR